jgi:hypothetical protein
MAPNAIQNAQESQLAQADMALAAVREKIDIHTQVHGIFQTGIHALDSMGKIPALTDVQKIATAIRCMIAAQMTLTKYNMDDLGKQVDMINKAVESIRNPSRIHKATLIGG